MKIHALQTGSGYVKQSFLNGSIKAGGTLPFLIGLHRASPYVEIPIYAWAIEHDGEVIVIDTGDIASAGDTWLVQFRRNIKPEQEIEPQLAKLGIKVQDVTRVVLTHIHSDHANGVALFLDRPIWVSEREHKSFHSVFTRVINRLTLDAPKAFNPQPFAFLPEPIGPFESSFPLTKDGNVRVVPTPGHVSVIAINNGISTFIAGDVTYEQSALLSQTMQGPSEAPDELPDTLARVLAYTQAYPTIYLPSHDPESGNRLANADIVPMQREALGQPV